jgi:hypothetical protein
MAGIRASKAARLMAKVEALTHRTRKGRHKAPKLPRSDAKKKGGKPGGRIIRAPASRA